MFNAFLSLFRPMPDAAVKLTDKQKIDKTYRKMRIQVFMGLYLGYIVYYFTRKNIAPLLHIFSKELMLDITSLGIIGSTLYVTYGIGKFVSGAFVDKTNLRFFMAFGLFGSSVINLFYGFLPSLWLLAIFWGLNGAFQSMGAPPTAKGMVNWFSPKERATIWSLHSSAHTAGTFLIGIIVAFILKHYDWRAAFYIPGIIGIVTSVYIFKSLFDKPASVGLPPIEEYKKDPAPVKKESGLTHWQTLKKYIFLNPHAWFIAFAFIFIYFVRFATLDWGTKFLYDVRGIGKSQAALLWSFMPLIGMPGGILGAICADRFFKGRVTPINVIMLISLAVVCILLYKYASADRFVLTALLLGLIGFFVDGPQFLVGSVQISRLVPQEAVGTAYGFVGLFGYVGAVLSGIGAAMIINIGSWGALYYGCAISCAISIFFLALTWRAESRGAKIEQEKARLRAEQEALKQ